MHSKKALHLIVILFMLVPFFGKAQIITSKKEAIKKGIYEKPEYKKIAPPEKPKLTAAVEPKPKEVKKNPVPAKTKVSKSILNEKEETDLDLTDDSENYLAMQMINNAMTFLGVRYHGGGTTKSGMDCSGMVTAVFNIFEKKLPRSSAEMSRIGQKVDADNARKGDLIFFHTNGKRNINHVGMVVEVLGDEIKFIHSSSSEGVIVSSTKEPYYKRNLVQVNRVL